MESQPQTRRRNREEEQDVGHSGDQAPDFGADYGNVPEIDPAMQEDQIPPTPRPADGVPCGIAGAASGEMWGFRS